MQRVVEDLEIYNGFQLKKQYLWINDAVEEWTLTFIAYDNQGDLYAIAKSLEKLKEVIDRR